MQSQLKASPLIIEHHVFRSIQVDAAEVDTPQGPHSLRTRRRIERNHEDPRRWMMILTVEFDAAKEGEATPYTGMISVQGWFTIAEGYPEEKQSVLIEVTAASILYGACREMLASYTARSVHGILSIPSVSFEPITRPEITKSSAKTDSASKPKKASAITARGKK